MSNITTTAFMIVQAHSCLELAMKELTSQPKELDWANRIYRADSILCKVFKEIINESQKEESMDKQINKVKGDIKKGNKKKAVKDVNKLLKMDKKFDKKLDKCAKMSKKKGSR